MLVFIGSTDVKENWNVDEKEPTVFSRVYYIRRSDVIYKDRFGERSLKANYMYIMPTTIPYSCTRGEIGLDCTYIHIYFDSLYSNSLVEIDVSQYEFLKKLWELIEISIENKDNKILNLLTATLESYIEKMNFISQAPDKIKNAMIYLSQHYNEEISIKKLSYELGYNQEYFIRIFEKYSGESPYQYLLNIRFHNALKLLKQSYSICDVADMSGFKDINSFSRSFKSRYGVTPSHYKKYVKITP